MRTLTRCEPKRDVIVSISEAGLTETLVDERTEGEVEYDCNSRRLHRSFLLLPHSLDEVLWLPTHQLLAQLGVNLFIADFGEDICKHIFC